MSIAVEVVDVSKHFRLYKAKPTSFKERFIQFGRIPYEDFRALNDINIEVKQGDTIGLLGHNGSGKSTLLKCIAGVLRPSTGSITLEGRIAALLELGAGFHPDLTGRENVYLNAALLGLTRKDVDKRFDDIVAFAELEQFIDNQVKFYSSGMYVRLGFSVAVSVEPEILLVDEVLAVGDEAFQRKCLDRVRRLQREGRTIVFVTHGADLVRQICDCAVVLDHGEIVASGTAGEAVRAFREHLLRKSERGDQLDPAAQAALAETEPVTEIAGDGNEQIVLSHGDTQESLRNFQIRINSVTFRHHNDAERSHLLPDEPLVMEVNYSSKIPMDDVVFGIAVYDLEGFMLVGTNTKFLGMELSDWPAEGVAKFSFERIPLLDGDYLVTLGVHSKDEATVYDWHEQQYRFSVLNPGLMVGRVSAPLTVTVDDVAPARAAHA